MQQVFSQAVTGPTGKYWMTFELEEPFEYTGDNLVVAIFNPMQSYLSGERFNNTNTPGQYRSIQTYSDGTVINPAAPVSYGSGYIWYDAIPNMKFFMCPASPMEYHVYRDGEPIGITKKKSFIDTEFDPWVGHTWCVKSVCPGGDESALACVTVNDACIEDPDCDPAVLSVARVGNANQLTWISVPAGLTARVYRDGVMIAEDVTSPYNDEYTALVTACYTVDVKCPNGFYAGMSNEVCTEDFEGCDAFVIGAGTTTTYDIPVNTYWGYSYTQQIFSGAELGAIEGMYMVSIAYEYIWGVSNPKDPVTIYIGHTTKNEFGGTTVTEWIPVSQMTQVFTGAVEFNNSEKWYTIEFDDPFLYEGGNIVVAVLNNHGSYNTSSNLTFRTHAVTGANNNKTLHYRSDTSPVNLNALPAASGRLTTRNNTNFGVCTILPDIDMAAISITGPNNVTVPQTYNYTVTVKNKGFIEEPVSNYTVQIFDENNNPLSAAILRTEPLPRGETDAVIVPVTFAPAMVGALNIKGVVNIAGDEVPENDETKLFPINVLPEGTVVIKIGDGNVVEKVPYYLYYRKSLSQTIYFPHEMCANGGIINKVTYQASVTTTSANLQNIRIRVWIGEVDDITNLSADWVDPTIFKEVYDGIRSFPAGNYDFDLPLTTPYEYGGKTLVIYSQRYDSPYGSSSDGFRTTMVPNSGRSRLVYKDGDPEYSHTNPSGGGGTTTVIHGFPNVDLLCNMYGMGSLSGTVTNTQGMPLAGVRIEVTGTPLYAITNANGYYGILYLKPDSYDLEAHIFGYLTGAATVAITANTHTIQNFVLEARPQHLVFGVVKAAEGHYINDATLKLEGYDDYQTTSGLFGEFGVFEFQNVYVADGYVLTVTAPGYQKYTAIVNVEGHTNLGTIIMYDVTFPPANVLAVNKETYAEITWEEPIPVYTKEFRHDSGINGGQIGFGTGTSESVIGSVHNETTELLSMSWYSTDEVVQSAYNLWILGLTGGVPDRNKVLAKFMNIPNVPLQWNTYEFPNAVACPEGFFIGVSPTNGGFTSVGTDLPNAEWPYIEGAHFYSISSAYAFSPFHESGNEFRLSCMVRAIGTAGGKFGYPANSNSRQAANKLEQGPAPTYIASAEPVVTTPPAINRDGEKGIVGYKLWRLQPGQEENETLWTTLTTNPVAVMSYNDITWPGVPTGCYKWAVKTCYHGGVESAPAFSNALCQDMYVEINITTNSGDSPAGANVVLKHSSGAPTYTGTSGDNGVTIPDVFPGTYALEITLEGFHKYEGTVVVTGATSYSAELIEIIVAPEWLDIEVDGCSALFSWNNAPPFTPFHDDMESYQDFIISNIGEYTLIDVDGANTFSHSNFTWPNATAPKAFIVFNPSQTSPSMSGEAGAAPHGGSKYLAAFNADNAGFWQDDWLILPKMTVVNGVILKFWAKSFSDQYSLERFKVGVSTTGTTPSDFTFIQPGNYVTVPITWTEYSYDLSAYANQDIYIAINCVSVDSWFFMLDDISVILPGKGGDSKAFLGYNVYLDGVLEAQTEEEQYTFTNVSAGDHVAGVSSLYTSGESEIVTIEFTITDPNCKFYTVTFNVTDEKTGEPVEDAIIEFNGVELPGYVATKVPVGDHPWKVTAENYELKEGTATVTNQDITVNVELMPLSIIGYELGFGIYPNPTTDKLTIERTAATAAIIELYSAMGAHVAKYETTEAKFEINVATLSAGTYFIRVTEDGKTGVKSFVKK